MPGQAGNFIARLFSLTDDTMPLLTRNYLQYCIESGGIPADFDRLQSYKFSSVLEKFDNWQHFHNSYADFNDWSHYNLLNIFSKEQFSRIVFPLHPHEFIASLSDSAAEFYHVDLDVDKWGAWVDTQQQNLNFYYRDNEYQQFEDLKKNYNMQSISLDQLLESQRSFLAEYNRVCDLMGIVPLPQQALALRKDWMSVRVDQSDHNKIYTISQPHYDDFAYDLFVDLVKSYPKDREAYYLWTNPPRTLNTFLSCAPFSSSTIFIGTKDSLEGWGGETFNWWQNRQLDTEKIIRDMVKKHSDKKFVLFVGMENVDIILDEPNLHIIPWGGEIVNQRASYTKLKPVMMKNFQSDKTFICLNRNSRDHRIVALSYLFGTGIAESGMISYLDDPGQDKSMPFLDRISWEFGPEHDEIRTKILRGSELIKSSDNFVNDTFDIYHVYGNQATDNIGNFENRLRYLYQNSFVEIVTESSFAPTSFIVTEKTAHAFYGCNFPIILGGAGIIAHLRELGLDMFDDVIDHSYDFIQNPFDRIVSAIESNRRLLTDPEYAKKSWKDCESRFENNVRAIKNIYSYYEQRARHKLSAILDQI
jgi:hypothetical protein